MIMARRKGGGGTSARLVRTERVAVVDTCDELVRLTVPLTPGATGAASLDGLAASFSRAAFTKATLEWRPLVFSEQQSTAAVSLAVNESGRAFSDFLEVAGYAKTTSGPVYKTLTCSSTVDFLRSLCATPGLRCAKEPGFELAIVNPAKTRVVGQLWLTYAVTCSGRLPSPVVYSSVVSIDDAGTLTVTELPGNNIGLTIDSDKKALPDILVEAEDSAVGRNLEIVPIDTAGPLPAVHAEHLRNDPDVRVTAWETFTEGGIEFLRRVAFSLLRVGVHALLRRLLPGLRPVVAALTALQASPPPLPLGPPAAAAARSSEAEDGVVVAYSKLAEAFVEDTGFWAKTYITHNDFSNAYASSFGTIKGFSFDTSSISSYPGSGSSLSKPSGTYWYRVYPTKVDASCEGDYLLITSTGRGAIGAPWGGYNYGSIATPKYSGRTGWAPIAMWQGPLTGASSDGYSPGQTFLIMRLLSAEAALAPIKVLSGTSTIDAPNGVVFWSISKLNSDDSAGTLIVRRISRQEVLFYLALCYEGGFQSRYCLYYDGAFNAHTMPTWYTSNAPSVYSDDWLRSLPGGVGVGDAYQPMEPGRYADLRSTKALVQ